jgi:DNA-directed RNA polymerase subunit omega
MRDDYLDKARAVITDPYILVNVVSRRVKQLRRGYRPLIQSLEKLAPEDIALREIAEGLIGYEIAVIPPDSTDTTINRRVKANFDVVRAHAGAAA